MSKSITLKRPGAVKRCVVACPPYPRAGETCNLPGSGVWTVAKVQDAGEIIKIRFDRLIPASKSL